MIKIINQYLKFIFNNPLNFIICIAWGAILLGYWRGINNHIPVLRNFTDELEWMIVVVPLAFSLKYWSKILKVKDIVFVLCCISVYLLNYIIFPQNEQFLGDRFFRFSILVLPYFFIGIALDVKKYLNALYGISVISIGFCAFYQLIYAQGTSYSGDTDVSEYNMMLAYNILPHVLMVSWIALRDLRIGKIMVMLLGVFLLLALGTRGPVLCEVIFLAVYLLLFKPSKYKLLKNLSVITIAILLLRYLKQFMMFMQVLVMQMGLSTRIFDKFLEGELETSDTRLFIVSRLLTTLKSEDAILGFGILGSYNYVDTYPHNIFLDFVFSFGWIIGIALLLLLLSLIIIALCRCNSEEEKVFVILLVCASIVKLSLSSTFIDDTLFFMLLGYCVHCIRKNRIPK